MRKTVIAICLTLGISMTLQPFASSAEEINTDKPSKVLLYHDMVISMIELPIQKQIDKFYSTILTISPGVAPFQIYVENANRLGGFRHFNFILTVKVTPIVGPHIPVGVDKFTFKIGDSKAKLIKFTHIKTMTKELPPRWQHIVR